MMSTLLCGGVAVQDGTTSLYDACSRGDTPIVKQLLVVVWCYPPPCYCKNSRWQADRPAGWFDAIQT